MSNQIVAAKIPQQQYKRKIDGSLVAVCEFDGYKLYKHEEYL